MGANQSSSPSGEDLYAAAEAGSAAEVGRLLSEGAPVNWKHESMVRHAWCMTPRALELGTPGAERGARQ